MSVLIHCLMIFTRLGLYYSGILLWLSMGSLGIDGTRRSPFVPTVQFLASPHSLSVQRSKALINLLAVQSYSILFGSLSSPVWGFILHCSKYFLLSNPWTFLSLDRATFWSARISLVAHEGLLDIDGLRRSPSSTPRGSTLLSPFYSRP